MEIAFVVVKPPINSLKICIEAIVDKPYPIRLFEPFNRVMRLEMTEALI